MTEPQPIWRLLRQLRALLIETDWQGGDIEPIKAAISRLEMLQSYGERYDVDH